MHYRCNQYFQHAFLQAILQARGVWKGCSWKYIVSPNVIILGVWSEPHQTSPIITLPHMIKIPDRIIIWIHISIPIVTEMAWHIGFLHYRVFQSASSWSKVSALYEVNRRCVRFSKGASKFNSKFRNLFYRGRRYSGKKWTKTSSSRAEYGFRIPTVS